MDDHRQLGGGNYRHGQRLGQVMLILVLTKENSGMVFVVIQGWFWGWYLSLVFFGGSTALGFCAVVALQKQTAIQAIIINQLAAMIHNQLLTPPRPHKTFSDTRSDVSTDHDDLEHPTDHDPSFPSLDSLPSKHRSSKAKSSLCRNFTEKGFCPYGNKCQFAHGPHQLRINMESNRSYKTKGCHAFAKKGYCCYGDRCNFIHVQETVYEDPIQKWALINSNHRDTMREVREGPGSRLMAVLGADN